MSHNAEKLKGGPFGIFQHPSVAKHQKIEGGTLWEIFVFEKTLTVPKKLKGDPLFSPAVCYAEKEEKLFWFSSLGQLIQFGTIKFRIIFKNYFGQFVWIEKTSRERPKSAPYLGLKKTRKRKPLFYNWRKQKLSKN